MSKAKDSDDSNDSLPREILTTDDLAECDTGDVIEAGDTTLYVVGSAMSLLGPAPTRVIADNGRSGKVGAGVLHADTEEGGIAWIADVDDTRPSRDDLIAEYGDIHVVDTDLSAVVRELPEATHGRGCPDCGDGEKSGGVYLWKHVSGNVIYETYRCKGDDCDSLYRYSRQFPEPTTAVMPTYDRESEEYGEKEIHGVFESHHTGNWDGLAALGQGKDTPEAVYTAEEVAAFMRGKVGGSEEPFGFVEYGGGKGKSRIVERENAPTWWDESGWNWNAKVQFVPVDDPSELTTVRDD